MRALMYHDIGDEGRYALSENRFREHLQLLGDQPNVDITFDDGLASQMKAAILLEDKSLSATFFITTSFVNRPGFLTGDQIVDLIRRGHQVGLHGHTHRFLSSLPETELIEELSRSKSYLEDLLGQQVDRMSCPGGRFNQRVLKTAQDQGLSSVFTSEPGSWRFEGPVIRQGRDAVLSNWSAETLESWLTGGLDRWRVFRYHLLRSTKKVFGDRLYHKITSRESEFG